MRAFERGDIAGAQEIHRRLRRLFKDLFIEPNPVPVKTALAWRGSMSSEVRLPLCEMTRGERSAAAKNPGSVRAAGLMSEPVRVLLVGAAGRMGQAIKRAAEAQRDIEIAGRVDLGDRLEPPSARLRCRDRLQPRDATERSLRGVRRRTEKPIVIGTTGHTDASN